MEVLTPVRVVRSPRRHVGGVAAGAPDAAYRAYQLLYFGFIAAPIIAGVDKFFNALTDWHHYLAPWLASLTGGGFVLMKVVGVIEIVAGCLVAFAPRYGAAIVALWLWGIVINLLSYPGYFDIALRDFGLSLGAIALSELALEFRAPRAVVAPERRTEHPRIDGP